jgi:hypothetical protein
VYSSHGHITQRVPENDKKPEIIWDQERKGKVKSDVFPSHVPVTSLTPDRPDAKITETMGNIAPARSLREG